MFNISLEIGSLVKCSSFKIVFVLRGTGFSVRVRFCIHLKLCNCDELSEEAVHSFINPPNNTNLFYECIKYPILF